MLDDVFSHLTDPDFQNPESGLMTFPAYVYVYPPEREYELRVALPLLRERLMRPNVGQEPLLVNVYEELLTYLGNITLGGRPLLDRIFELEVEDPEKVNRQLRQHATSEAFTDHLASLFSDFVKTPGMHRRSYVFVNGWGSIFPYLRASHFLDLMEHHLHGYKLILFYPGDYHGGQFRLFGRLASKRVYRGSCLNELIGA